MRPHPTLILSILILLSFSAFESSAGLYPYYPGDQMQLIMKDWKPTLKISIPNVPDIEACKELLEMNYDHLYNVSSITGGQPRMALGLSLQVKKECNDALDHVDFSVVGSKTMVQEIAIYDVLSELFSDADEVKKRFEDGTIAIAIVGQTWAQYEAAMFIKPFTFSDVQAGRILIAPQNESFWLVKLEMANFAELIAPISQISGDLINTR